MALPDVVEHDPHVAAHNDERSEINDILTSIADLLSTISSNQTAISANETAISGLTTSVAGKVDTKNGGKEVVSTATVSASPKSIDLSVANIFNYTLTTNVTFSFTGATSGVACSITLFLKQDATGSRIVTWPASVKWGTAGAPTLSTAANALDIVSLLTLDGGTTWYAFLGGKGF